MTAKICSICHTAIPSGAPGGFCPACVLRGADELVPAAPPGGPPLEEVRAAFPQLEVQALIGQGGMGFVYKARQPSLDRTVALKILAPALVGDPAFAERFAREARVLGKLSHPNIVTVFEHGVTQPATPGARPFYYLLMEYVDGVNLRQAMRAGRFTPAQALSVVPGICDALQAAHAQGIWHRDIKPENILLDTRGGVKIADFGIARLVGDPARDFTITVTGAALGSAAYMAPEQHEKPHDVDHRADIYSLGVVIYEMLTGELPLGRFPAPSQRAAVDARIDEIVLRTLEKERALRQQSAEEVKTDVSRATVAPLPARPDADRLWTPRMFSQMAVVAGVVLFAGAAGLTHGSNQNTLLTLSLVPFVLGLIGLYLFRRREVPGVQKRHFSRGVVAGALLAGIVVASVVIVEHRNMERALAKARLAEEREKLTALKAAAAVVQRPSLNPSAPAEPSESPVDVLRRMNALANEANGEDFAKHLKSVPGPIFAGTRATPVGKVMEPFYGRMVWAKPERRTDVLLASVVAEFVRPGEVTAPRAKVIDGTDPNAGRSREMIEHREFHFWLHDGRWLFSTDESPRYRVAARVEFRPEKGDALAILRQQVSNPDYIVPASAGEALFDVFGESRSPESAQRVAASLAEDLKEAFAKAGLGTAFRVVEWPSLPSKPAVAEEPENPAVFDSTSRSVLVAGMVAKPGQYSLAGRDNITVSNAVALAGEALRAGDTEKVQLLHQSANGKVSLTIVNLKAIMEGTAGPGADPVVQAGDRIVVPHQRAAPR